MEQRPRLDVLKQAILEKQMRTATICRDRAIYKFKREFFMTVASRESTGMATEEANKRADELVFFLFPEVTEQNMGEYIERAW